MSIFTFFHSFYLPQVHIYIYMIYMYIYIIYMIVYINIGNSKGLLVTFIQNHCILSLFAILSLFLDKQLAITIYSKASQKEFCMFRFSLRTKVYKMRFDSSTLNSISDVVPLGEVSTTQRLG